MSDVSNTKRRRVNLSIREDVMEAAKALSLNASRAAEAGIAKAVTEAREAQWRAENKVGISAHNARIEKDGTLLRPDWAKP